MESKNKKYAVVFLGVCMATMVLRFILTSAMHKYSANTYKRLVWTETEEYKSSHELLRYATFTDIRQFLSTTEEDVLSAPPPKYLPDVKNPCFALTHGYVNVANISIMVAIEMEFEIRCLPAVYVAGFQQCGTQDFHTHLTTHPLLHRDSSPPSTFVPPPHLHKSHFIDTHFWDNCRCDQNVTMDHFTQRHSSEPIVEAFRKYAHGPTDPDIHDDLREMLYVDHAPRIATHGDSWNEEPRNWKGYQPYVIIARRVQYITPSAKTIFLVCEPVARTVADYSRFDSGNPDDFHDKVKDALAWWIKCNGSKIYERMCAFGPAPIGFPFHNTLSCGMLGFASEICPGEGEGFRHWGCGNSVDRLRLSLYYTYVKEWWAWFQGSGHVLVLRTEDMQTDLLGTLKKVTDFLNVEEFSEDLKEVLRDKNVGTDGDIKVTIRGDTRRTLQKFFQPSNELLSQMLGYNQSLWTY